MITLTDNDVVWLTTLTHVLLSYGATDADACRILQQAIERKGWLADQPTMPRFIELFREQPLTEALLGTVVSTRDGFNERERNR